MQYKVVIDGKLVEVSFERTATGIEATIGNRAYSLEVSPVEPGVYLLAWGSRCIEVVALAIGDVTSVSIEGHRIPVEILDGRKMLQRTVRSGDRGGASEMRSPMPGKIIRVLMAEGAEVAAGQGIVVMEAMKMQNEIKSSIAGRVQRIAVVEGDTVQSGALIAVVESMLPEASR
jgi:biotin carboxyl carrier protein